MPQTPPVANRFSAFLLFPFGVLVAALTFSLPAMAQIQRVSTAVDGTESNHDSYEADLSDDGSIIAYRSSATNLVAGDTNELPDVFVRDLTADTLERASVNDDETEMDFGFYRNAYAPSISNDGNKVAFNGYNAYAWVFLRDRVAGTTAIIMPPSSTPNNGDKSARQEPFLSGNGQFLVWHAVNSFLSSEPVGARPKDDDDNGAHDVFLYDVVTQPVPILERISRPDFTADMACVTDPGLNCPEGNADSFSASLSDDGRRVAFYSFASNLVDDDDNDFDDVFVKFRYDAGDNYAGIAGPIIRVSESSAGVQGNDHSQDPILSGNGQFVAFRSRASNLVSVDNNDRWDIFVHDLSAGVTTRVSVSSAGAESNSDSFAPSISDDGRFVVFRSNASNLVASDANQRHDIFVHDRTTGTTAIVSVPSGGGESNGHSYEPVISGDGQFIAFESDATNLVAADTNKSRDIFRADNPLAGGGL